TCLQLRSTKGWSSLTWARQFTSTMLGRRYTAGHNSCRH
ncbi:hypothetical protein AK812_SmicGene47945, partial [Symbiodinium microadriaticum]